MLPAWVGQVGPATPGYWAMAAYQAALGTGQSLGRPLLALAAFTVGAFLAAAWFGRRTD